MHFAFPPRTTSHPPPYAVRNSRSPFLRRGRLQNIALTGLGAIGLLWFVIHLISGSGTTRVPSGTPSAVLVTVLDPKDSETFNSAIRENRRDYASRHGMHISAR